MKDQHDKTTIDLAMPKRGRGRPAIHGEAMSAAERQRRYRKNSTKRICSVISLTLDEDLAGVSSSRLLEYVNYQMVPERLATLGNSRMILMKVMRELHDRVRDL